MTLCAHCGAEYSAGLNAACRECRLASDPSTPPTLPDLEDGPDEILFDLSLWSSEERVGVGLTLDDRSIPYRWEPGPELVVRESDGDVVEDLLDEDEGDDGDWEEVDEAGEPVGDELADDDDDDEDDDEDEDDGEATQSAMGDLFDAADRLMRNPANVEALADVDRLGVLVDESPPPFGVEAKTWEDIGSLADAVLGAGDEEDDEAVAAAARSLRDFLRKYV